MDNNKKAKMKRSFIGYAIATVIMCGTLYLGSRAIAAGWKDGKK